VLLVGHDAAVRLAKALAPRVILLDYALPDVNGLVALIRIRRTLPEVAIVMLSMHDEEALVRRALSAGARGYIVKDATAIDLADVVRRVANGETVVTPPLRPAAAAPDPGSRLTNRELEVLALICRGVTSRAIAAELELSVSTVRIHRANIMRTLGVRRTTALVAFAAHHGLISIVGDPPRVQSRKG
jgi:DNA-binding NarL/FixJ family response regulator